MNPAAHDATGALVSRLVVLILTESFYGRGDHKLGERPEKELPGVLNWAVKGWQELKNRGYFYQPDRAN